MMIGGFILRDSSMDYKLSLIISIYHLHLLLASIITSQESSLSRKNQNIKPDQTANTLLFINTY